MNHRGILFFILLFSAILFVVNALAIKYDLYFVTTWFDSISHTLGGFIAAASFIYIYAHMKAGFPKGETVFFFVLAVGVIWEFFELYTGLTGTSRPGYYLDTAGDIVFDLLGTYLGFYLFSKKTYAR